MNKTRQLFKYFLIGGVIASLAGCVVRPALTDAHVNKGSDNTEAVEVKVSADDAKKIKDREIYFSIVVVDCNDHENRFPIEPYVAGKLASKFDFPITGAFVTVQGSMPERVLANFPTPCVALQGGSYVFGKLESTPVPLVRMAR